MLVDIYKVLKYIISYPYKKCKEILSYKKRLQYLCSIVEPMTLKKATGELRKTQENYLKFAIELNKICEDIGVTPFMIGGSLIGALRHKGYIPWDDDLDFGLIAEDYDKFIEYAKNNFVFVRRPMNRFWSINRRLKFENDLIKSNINKIIVIYSPDMLQVYKGTSLKDFVIVDFFPYAYFADNYNFLEHQKYLKTLNKKLKNINNFVKEIDFLKCEKQKNKNIVVKSNNIYAAIDHNQSFGAGLPINAKDFWHYSDFYPLKKMKFEDTEFWAPNNAEKVVEYQYGKNWNKIPLNVGVMTHRELINNFNKKYNK